MTPSPAAQERQRILALDGLLRGERFAEAARAIDAGLGAASSGPELRWRLRLRRGELDLLDQRHALDEALLRFSELVAEQRGGDEERLRLHGRLIQGLTQKRCFSLAERAERAALREHGETPLLLVRRGDRALASDDREQAKSCYERALELSASTAPASGAADDGEATYALANLLYVAGEFDRVREVAEGIPRTSPVWLASARLRASVEAAVLDYEAEAQVWREILTHHGDGDFADRDRVALGLAISACDRLGEALEVFRQVWRRAPESQQGRYARARMEAAQLAPEGARRRRLHPFPTTSQKRHQCGPAVIDLCLRYLDVDLDFEQIDAAVRRGEGTPMHEIGRFLAHNGVASRRIEINAARLKAAIDLGLPVIVQEEYATTAHVAVITGYDQRLDLFIANDPTSHRQLFKSYAWLEQAGDIYGNGGLLVLGSAGEGLSELERRVDAAGLREAPHLRLLDERERERAGLGSRTGTTAFEEVIRLADQALALAPGFKLAWYERARAYISLWGIHRDAHHRRRALAALYDLRTRFSEEKWPYQLHGHLLAQEERYEEAYVAYHDAWLRDPGDASNLDAMGRSKLLAGDLEVAEEHLLEALRVDPAHLTAPRNLASLYLRQLELVDEQREASLESGSAGVVGSDERPGSGLGAAGVSLGGRSGQEDPSTYARLGVPQVAQRQLRRAPATVLRRAQHFAEVSCSRSPQDAIAYSLSGALAVREGRFAAAREAFRKAVGLGNFAPWTITGLAVACEQLGQQSMALRVLQAGCQQFRGVALPWLALAGTLARRGQLDGAVQTLRQAMEQVLEGRDEVVRTFFRWRSRAAGAPTAAAELRRFAEGRPGDAALLRTVAELLDESGQRGHAIALFRRLVAAGPRDVVALYRLGRLLAKTVATRDEAAALLERVVELAPPMAEARLSLAWISLAQNARRALDLLQPLTDESPQIWSTRAQALRTLGRDAEGQGAEQRALDCAGDPHEGRLSLIAWHRQEGRFDQALRLAEGIDVAPLSAGARRAAEIAWLGAHRLAGKIPVILERVRELCPEGRVQPHLAFDIYHGLSRHDDPLAARAALVLAVQEPERALTWRIRAAGCLARSGRPELLDELLRAKHADAMAWVELSHALRSAGRVKAALDAAERARTIDPGHRDVLRALEEAHQRAGSPERALRVARRLLELYPFEHHGAERVGATLARLGRIDEALEHTAAALDAGPYSEGVHGARAIACFMAGRLDEARQHAEQREAMLPSRRDDRASLMILRALEGDLEAVERGLAIKVRTRIDVYPMFERRLREVARGRAEG
jgi:tetratricopeptide (TPR) repeat protein